jgi:acyl-CoA thioester hydrolase
MEQWTFPYTMTIPVRFRDLDALGHVNNAVYLTYFEQVRIEYGLQLLGSASLSNLPFILAESAVTYLKPAHFGDRIEIGVRVSEIGTKSFVMEYSLRNTATGEPIARGRTVQVWYDYSIGRSAPVPDYFRRAVEHDNAKLTS